MLDELLEDRMKGAVRLDGFDEAIIGVATSMTMEDVIAYDQEKLLSILEKMMGCDRAGADEYFEFNILCSYMGERNPVYVELL